MRARLDERGLKVVDDPGADAVLLVNDELGSAGDHAEAVLADAVAHTRPGGWLVVGVANALRARKLGTKTAHRSWHPGEIDHLLGSRGVQLTELWAPGAGALLSGMKPHLDLQLDREPSLLGTGEHLLAIGRTPANEAERSSVFFATLPRKTVASATLTRHPDGRILVVYDRFKAHWTIPGGVADADEDPESAAVRETREETGLDVRCTGLLGVFHAVLPDRLVFVFDAETTGDLVPAPLHLHEIGDVEWVGLDEAVTRVAPYVAEQIRLSIQQPGNVWRQ